MAIDTTRARADGEESWGFIQSHGGLSRVIGHYSESRGIVHKETIHNGEGVKNRIRVGLALTKSRVEHRTSCRSARAE